MLSDDIIDGVLKSVVNAYDPLYGGFGDAPKFPHTDALDLLMYVTFAQAIRTYCTWLARRWR